MLKRSIFRPRWTTRRRCFVGETTWTPTSYPRLRTEAAGGGAAPPWECPRGRRVCPALTVFPSKAVAAASAGPEVHRSWGWNLMHDRQAVPPFPCGATSRGVALGNWRVGEGVEPEWEQMCFSKTPEPQRGAPLRVRSTLPSLCSSARDRPTTFSSGQSTRGPLTSPEWLKWAAAAVDFDASILVSVFA